MKRHLFVIGFLLSAIFPAIGPTQDCAAAAQGSSHAGLVIEYPNGETASHCVAFSGVSITGLDLLRRAGVAVTYQDYGGGNVTVCSIDGQGCAYPKVPCWCRCASTTASCEFWGYYIVDPATKSWQFSAQGVATTVVHDGDVQGWRWGAHGPGGAAPPKASADRICAGGERVSVAGARPRGDSKVPVILTGMAAVLVIAAGFALQRRKPAPDA